MSEREVVKITRDDDGDLTGNDSWHLVDPGNQQGRVALCTQEFFGIGEGVAEFETGDGAVTCRDCIRKIKIYKAVKIRPVKKGSGNLPESSEIPEQESSPSKQ